MGISSKFLTHQTIISKLLSGSYIKISKTKQKFIFVSKKQEFHIGSHIVSVLNLSGFIKVNDKGNLTLNKDFFNDEIEHLSEEDLRLFADEIKNKKELKKLDIQNFLKQIKVEFVYWYGKRLEYLKVLNQYLNL